MSKLAKLRTQQFVGPKNSGLNAVPNNELQKLKHTLSNNATGPVVDGFTRLFSPEDMRRPIRDEDRPPKLCGDLIHAGDVVALSGPSGTGKSAVLVYLLNHFVRPGHNFLQHPRLPNSAKTALRALYLELEMNEATVRMRHSSYWGDVHYMDINAALAPEELDSLLVDRFPGNRNERHLYKLIRSGQWDVIAVDSLSMLVADTKRDSLGPMLVRLKACLAEVAEVHGRRVTIVFVAHTVKGTKSQTASMDQNHGDSHFANQMDVVLSIRHAREPNQTYIVQNKSGRYSAGAFTGVDGDGQCLVFTRFPIEDPHHGQQYGLELDKLENYERDHVPNINAALSDERKDELTPAIAGFIIEACSRKNPPENPLTFTAVQKRIQRAGGIGQDSRKPNAGTIENLSESVVELIKDANRLDVLKMLSNEWFGGRD